MSAPVEIDGSAMEGGGQVIRTAVALSSLTGKPVHVRNIRSNRPNPGLRTQHLRGIEAVARLCGGRLENARIGSREILFYPGKTAEKELRITLDTAASIGLVLQSLLLSSVHRKEPLTVDIEGGATFGKFAPPLEYVQFVLLPLLRRMGYHSEINILRHGFYPVGGARAKVMINPCKGLRRGPGPLVLDGPGKVEKVDVISTASIQLKKPRVAERQARHAVSALAGKGFGCNVKTRYADSACPGSGLLLVARTENGCIIGSDGLGERGKSAEAVAEEAVKSLLDNLQSGASVDVHMGDQILPYMALSRAKSSVTVPLLTAHAETNMAVIREFLPVEFAVEREENVMKISCSPE